MKYYISSASSSSDDIMTERDVNLVIHRILEVAGTFNTSKQFSDLKQLMGVVHMRANFPDTDLESTMELFRERFVRLLNSWDLRRNPDQGLTDEQWSEIMGIVEDTYIRLEKQRKQ